MTVTGATTAAVATVSYTPPYKYVTNYPPAVQVTGTVTGPIDNNPTTGFQSGVAGDSQYAWAYLNAHMMSDPSYRYAYLLWAALALIALVYIIAHHVRLGRGSVPASLSRWSMKRYVIGSKKPGRKNRALPSNGILFVAILLVIPVIALSVIGADYIRPSAAVFNFAARALSERSSATAPKVTIYKSLWTLGSRFGFIAFALMPLVVLLALKSPPIAFLSLRLLAHLYADKLAFLHRATAWLIWAITTAHVVLWTVQLFEDSYQGIPTWVYLWGNYRFICGAVAYFAMTAVMVMSLRPVRKHKYELFYSSHMVLVAITIGACAAHHPVLWYWMAAAGGLWVGERIMRYLRFAHVNRLWGRRATRNIVAGQQYRDVSGFEYPNDHELKQSADFGQRDPYAEKAPRNFSGYSAHSHTQSGLNTPRNASYYDDQIIQPLDQHAMPYADPYGTGHQPTASASSIFNTDHKPSYTGRQSQSTLGLGRPPTIRDKPTLSLKPPPVPVGYAQAQLLPSRTIRLTVRTPRPFKWAPGQSCLLYLPELSKLQSHPFTILNNSGDTEIVLLVKARKGLTRKLYNMIRTRSLQAVGVTGPTDKRLSLPSMRSGVVTDVTASPVHVRAWVDGPFGSAARVHWNEFSTITIICGGSGVSFGAAVCDYVCRSMVERMGRRDRKFQTKRVRFCWVAREYAEIAWIAGQLYQCTQLVSPDQLQINIFVTHSRGNQYDRLSAPQPGFMKHGRRDSSDSVMSDMSGYGDPSAPDTFDESPDIVSYADVIDLTNYEDEEDVNDPAEMQWSDRLQHQGKIQRAKSRRAAKGSARAGRSVTSPTYTPSAYPPRRSQPVQDNEPSLLAYTEPDAEAQYDMAASGAPQALLSPASARFPSGVQDVPLPNPRSPLRTGTPRSSSAQYALPQSASMPMPPHVNTLPTSTSMPIHGGYSGGNEFGDASRPFHTISHARNDSFKSVSESMYARYDPYAAPPRMPSGADYSRATNSPAPSIWQGDDGQSIAGDSVRHLVPQTPRTGSMVFLENDASDPSADAGLWIDQADYQALNLMTEMASVGKPKLASLLEEEIERAEGRMIVATCGPVTLNAVVRNLVAHHISPSRMRHGDKRGHIAIYSEDYES